MYTLKRLTKQVLDGNLTSVTFDVSYFEKGNGVTKSFSLTDEELEQYKQDPASINSIAEKYAASMSIPEQVIKPEQEVISEAIELSKENIEAKQQVIDNLISTKADLERSKSEYIAQIDAQIQDIQSQIDSLT